MFDSLRISAGVWGLGTCCVTARPRSSYGFR